MLANLERKLRRKLILVMSEIEKYFSEILLPVLLELLERYLTPSKIISFIDDVRKILEWEEEKIKQFEIEKFEMKNQLASYIGLDPITIHSGQFSKNLHIVQEKF